MKRFHIAIITIGLSFAFLGTKAQAQWQEADIGDSMPMGYGFAGWEIEVYGGGAGIEGTSDQFFLFYEEGVGDDITLVAQLTGMIPDNPAVTTQAAGLMIRDSLDADSANVAIMLNLDAVTGGANTQWRDVAGNDTQYGDPSIGQGFGTYDYLKVTRSGDQFDFALSTDNVTWTPYGAQTIQMSGSIFVGIAVTSDEQDVGVTAYMADYAVTGNFAPISALGWDGLGDGNWGDMSGGYSRWLDADEMPTTELPAAGSNVEIQVDTVTVAQDRAANNMTVSSGGVIVAAGRTLAAAGQLTVDELASMTLQDQATLIAGGGSISAMQTAGTATIGNTSDLTVSQLQVGGASPKLVKEGAGTLLLDNTGGTGFDAAGATLEIAGGTVDTAGWNPLGGATAVVLSDGTLTVRVKPLADISTGFDNDTGQVIDGGLDDSGYTITPGDLAAFVLPDEWPVAPGVWVVNDDRSKWIGFAGGSSNADPGDYEFTTTVSLDDIDPATVVLTGSWSTDNNGLDILINGTSTGASNTAGFGAMHPLGTLGAGLFQAGENTIVFRMNNAMPADPPFSNPAGLRVEGGLYSLAPLDLSTTTVTVDGGGTFDPRHLEAVNMGSLMMKAGVLITTGTTPQINFQQTNIDSQAQQIGFDPQVATELGPIDGGSSTAVISKVGQGDLTLDDPGTDLAGATFSVQGGRLIGVHGQEPFGQAALELAGGELVLAGGASDSSAVFDNAASVTANSILTAGPAATGTTNVAVVLGSGSNALTLGEGSILSLHVEETDGYSLEIAAPISGTGGIHIPQGMVNFSGGGRIGSLEVTGGSVGTGQGQLEITESFTLGNSPFNAEPGTSFAVSGSDLLVETTLTLDGGQVTLGTPSINALVKDVSTGFDNATGTVIDGSMIDSDYMISPTNISAFVLPEAWPVAPGVWVANSDTSKWIGFDNGGSNTDPGIYDYTTTLSLDGFDAATATILGQWTADDLRVDILVNGLSIGAAAGAGFNALFPFDTLGEEFFLPGENTITFRVNNQGTALNPSGLRVDARVHADVLPEQKNVNLAVTAPSTLQVGTSIATLGDLTISSGARLTVLGAVEASFRNVEAAAGTSVRGVNLAVRETLAVTEGSGTLDLQRGLTFKSGSQWLLGVGTDAADQITVRDDAVIEADSTLTFRIDGADPFTAGTYVLIDSEGEDGVVGTFATVEGLGSYVTDGGLTYNDGELSLLIENNLHPGDADLSTATDLTDFNIWNARKFTSGTDWTAGDFNGDGTTDLSDFNIWNANKFTTASGGAAPAPTEVPEPGSLILLFFGLLAVAVRLCRPLLRTAVGDV